MGGYVGNICCLLSEQELVVAIWGIVEERCYAVSDERVRREKKTGAGAGRPGRLSPRLLKNMRELLKILIPKRLEVYALVDDTPREYVDACAKVVESVIGLAGLDFDCSVIGIIYAMANFAERVD